MTNTKSPKVSIVLVTYNRANELKEAIEQVLKQTYENIELLIGDDCSYDNTQEVIKSFNTNKIKNIRHEKNQGFFDNWQATLKYINSDYFIPIICDDDRLVDPNFIKDSICLFMQEDDIDMVFARVGTVINKKLTLQEHEFKNEYTGMQLVKDFYLYQKHLCLSTMILKKKYLDFFLNPNFKWDSSIVSNDQVLIYDILLHCKKIKFLNKVVYHWIREENIETFSNSIQSSVYAQLKNTTSLVEHVIPYLKEKNLEHLINSFDKYFLNHFEQMEMNYYLNLNQEIFEKLISENELKNKKIYIYGFGEVGIKLNDFLISKDIFICNFIDDIRKGEDIITFSDYLKNENEDSIIIIASYKRKIIHNIYKKLIQIPNKFKILELIDN
ncbi:glycosyltransferase family 2 protein [Malaciobacter mytili]|uniref:glycosyltransferase family 2 protein n=1 Tax=Malaciobacter mytili TaxID=603050 RepID=UPI003A84AB0E